ncbi:MAG: aminodeoxychorismate/anthranilate synthase component II [Planctomycetes bacterium]|nr:aminodeoxychorismate/anthranilate synthase component II [Planctomycetota bacterium]
MTPRVLLIDNYDSFTFNLVQAVRVLGADTVVRRNDKISLDELPAIDPTHLIVSPGPGRPEGARQSMPLIEALTSKIPVLGVCLGHQALAAVFGATIRRAEHLMHGKASKVYHDARSVFAGMPNPFPAGRYHSLCVEADDLPDCFVVSAYTSDGTIMGIRHREYAAEGVQFHPESILTPDGTRLLDNFLRLRMKESQE